MHKHSHAGSPFAHLASFPMTSRWSKEVESGRGGVLGVCWSFIQVIVPSGPLLCGEQGGGLAFSGCYKICSLYKPPNLSTRSSFLFVPRRTLISSITHIFPVVCLVLLERMCEMDSTLHSDVTYLFINHQNISNLNYLNCFHLNNFHFKCFKIHAITY